MYVIKNSRQQQYGPVFETYREAQKWLSDRVSSAAGKLQFSIEKVHDREGSDNGKER